MKGRIHISRPSYGSGKEAICIEVIDESSGVQFIELEMALADFTKAVTGQAHVDVEFELRGVDLVGMVRENKTEEVYMPDGDYDKREQRAARALKKQEVDGWKGRIDDCLNMHKRIGSHPKKKGSIYSVTFTRHVDANPGS